MWFDTLIGGHGQGGTLPWLLMPFNSCLLMLGFVGSSTWNKLEIKAHSHCATFSTSWIFTLLLLASPFVKVLWVECVFIGLMDTSIGWDPSHCQIMLAVLGVERAQRLDSSAPSALVFPFINTALKTSTPLLKYLLIIESIPSQSLSLFLSQSLAPSLWS